MTRTYRKNILRTFKSARSRFVAIFAIVALGVGFLAGLNATPVDMKESMERYLDDGNFYDLRIVSTMGLTDDDVEALRQVDGIKTVQPAYSADLLVEAGSDVVVSRLHSLPPEGDDAINKLVLAEGRMPETSGECVVEANDDINDGNFPIGSTLTVSSKDNEELDTKLACTQYTVVGIVHNTNYFSFEREPASVGNGAVELVMYLLPEDFAYDTYTEIYVTAEGALQQNSMEDEYEATVEAVQANVEAIQDARCQARYDEIRSDAQEEIDDAWAEYHDAEAEAQQKLADAAQELEDGRQELADGEAEYQDGEQQYADGVREVADNEAKINDGAAQLEEGRQELLDNQAKVEEGEAELAASEPQLAEARKKLEDGQAQYEAGLQQYNDALAQIEEGEKQLADGKAELDTQEKTYEAGLETMAAQITGMLQQQNPDLPLTVTSEDIGNFVSWLNDNQRPVPQTYDQLLDELDGYLQQYGMTADSVGLTSTARTMQQQAQAMLDQLSAMQPQPGGETEPSGGEEPAPDTDPPAEVLTGEPAETPEAPEEAAEPKEEISAATSEQEETEETASPESEAAETAGTETPDTTVVDEETETTTEPESLAAEEATRPTEETEAAPAEETTTTEDTTLEEETLPEKQTALLEEDAPQTDRTETAAKQKAPQEDPALPADPQLSPEQLAALAAQLQAIVDADRDGMETVLTQAQQWLLAQDEASQATPLLQGFALLVNGGLSGLETEQAAMGTAVTGFAQIVSGRRALDAGWKTYEANAQKVADGRQQLEASAPELEAARRELEDGWKQYNDGVAKYESGKRELADGRRQLEEGWATLTDKQLELEDARRQIADAKAELADARAELDEARQTIDENAQKLRDGEIEYEDARAEAEQELADARAKIEDGQKELDDIEMPEWYVWDRSNNVSYSSFTGNVDKLTAITTIFPVFFFLVAALVVSTTMTRMVEEERLQIGTLKALGYTRREIMRKYLWYALVAAVCGTAVGLTVGFRAFPAIIWSAYAMMYYMPAIYTPWRGLQALFAGGTLTALSVGVTALACRASLQEVPAALMLPRAPKAGKRILLERITPLWRRLPFTWKVTCRNLLRYKKRFWMTVIGVAGCMSLLVSGFGISDSLNAIITKQFSDVSHYDLMTVVTKEEATEQGEVYDYLYNSGQFTESMTVAVQSTRQSIPDGEADVYLMVPQDVTRFGDFLDLHERISRTPTPLGEEGVVLTEKFAKLLGVQAGDTVTLKNSDDQTGTFVVSGVCEHYVSNYVYMSPATYEAGFGEPVSFNAVISRMADDSDAAHDTISAALLEMDDVASLTFTRDTVAQVLNMLNSIDAVVVLIIVCAACLAFVVLYNLSNINIAERVKEIATIKVLGFYDREVYAYVNRESMALTLIGTLFGVFGGIALHRFIIVTVEVDAVMFGRDIHPVSFVYAIALTLLFSVLVNLVMGRTLKKISMVESMKAPE